MTKTKRDNEPKRAESSIVLSLSAAGKQLKNQWILDSGCTEHMCNNKRWFIDLVLFPTPRCTAVGSGDKLQVLAEGQVTLMSNVDGELVRPPYPA